MAKGTVTTQAPSQATARNRVAGCILLLPLCPIVRVCAPLCEHHVIAERRFPSAETPVKPPGRSMPRARPSGCPTIREGTVAGSRNRSGVTAGLGNRNTKECPPNAHCCVGAQRFRSETGKLQARSDLGWLRSGHEHTGSTVVLREPVDERCSADEISGKVSSIGVGLGRGGGCAFSCSRRSTELRPVEQHDDLPNQWQRVDQGGAREGVVPRWRQGADSMANR